MSISTQIFVSPTLPHGVWVGDGAQILNFLLIGIAWNIVICMENYVWNLHRHVSKPHPHECERRCKYPNFILVGIVWNVKIHTEKSCFYPSNLWVSGSGSNAKSAFAKNCMIFTDLHRKKTFLYSPLRGEGIGFWSQFQVKNMTFVQFQVTCGPNSLKTFLLVIV